MSNHLFDPLFGRHANSSAPFLYLNNAEVLNYSAFLDRAGHMANLFAQLGLVKGDRVALQVSKTSMALAVYAACLRSGLVLLPLNTAYTASEVGYFLQDAEPALVICDERDEDALRAIANGAAVRTLNADETGSLMDEALQMPAEHGIVACSADDLAAILYTSGTTGRSKGAMLSHANLLSNAAALADLWQFTSADVLLHALPIFHTHGLFVAVNVLSLVGGAMIFHPVFKAENLLADMPRATALMGVPTFYTRLLQDPNFTRDVAAHMRLFVSGSAPLLADTHVEFEQRTGHRILERYGMTETNMNASNPYDGARRPGTVGPALPGVEIRITNPDTGVEMPKGEPGMIEVRGPNVFQGYWRMPEKTAAELRENGFFITGDLGRFDDDGYLSIVGRQKDLIISGGYNIYPKEIEVLLDALPGVRESAVFGVADADFGEATIGVIVAEPGAVVDVDALLMQIKPQLARFKHPRRLEIVDELPRNTMGKVQKNILRQQYAP